VRHKVLGAAVLTAAALMLGGCGDQTGTDGNLTNEWTALPEAKIPVPPAEACYHVLGNNPTSISKWPPPVDCATSHTVETIYVGTFTGEDADRGSPPPAGGAGLRRVYATCMEQAKGYLGDDWRAGWLDLAVVTPDAVHWDAGARWYRCDVLQFKTLDNFEIVTRDAAIKGGLGGAKPVGLACVSIASEGTGDTVKIKTLAPMPCESAHNGEFAGIYEFPDGAWPTDPEAAKQARLAGCRGVVAAFAGIPNDADFRTRTGQVATPFTKADWELGNRGVRCWIWNGTKTFTGSLKGVGTTGLPINYA
jgi:hypothetical protein